MKSRQILTLSVIALLLFCVTGCFKKQKFEKQRYWLDMQRTKTDSGKTSTAILIVEPFSIDSAFRTRSIVYRRSAHKFEINYYGEYLIPPAKMVAEQTRRWLDDSGIFARVLQPGSNAIPTHVLEGHIVKAYVDASESGQPAAQFEVSVYLMKKENLEDEVLFGKTYSAREPMDSLTAEDYFAALHIAFTKVLQQCEKDLAALLD